MRSPTLSSSAFANKAPTLDGVLSLRGGGAIGPLDVEMLCNLQLLALISYSVELSFPALTNPSKKYFGLGSDSPWRTWFAMLHTFMTAALAYGKFAGGMGAEHVSKAVTSWFVTCVCVMLYQLHVSQSMVTKQGLYICGVLSLLGLVVNFV